MEYGLWGMDYERIEIKRRDWRLVEIRGLKDWRLIETAIGIMDYGIWIMKG